MPAREQHVGKIVGPEIGDELRSRDRLEDVVGRHREERIREHHDGREALLPADFDQWREHALEQHGHSLSDAETEVNCGSAHGCPAAAVLRHPARRRPPRPPLLHLHRGRHRRRTCWPRRSATGCSSRLRRRTRWSTSCAASPLVLSLFVPAYTLLAARLGARRMTIGTLALLQPERPPVLVRLQPSPDPARLTGGLLRLGELLRRDCPGAGLELRQLAVRHAPGQAAVRADRLRRVARRHRRRLPGQRCWSIRSAAPSTCCWCWRCSSRWRRRSSPSPIPASDGAGRCGWRRLRRRGRWQTVRAILASPYLRLIAAVVCLTAIVTQWTGLQLSLVDLPVLPQRRDRTHPIQWHLHARAGHGQLPGAAVRHQPGAAAVRAGGDDPRAAVDARLRLRPDRADAGVLAGAHHQRLRSGVPVLRRPADLRAAVSAAPAAGAAVVQERDRHHRHAHRRRGRRGGLRHPDASAS